MSELVPRLRFKQDDGSEFQEWQEHPLGKVSTFYDAKRVPLKDSDRQKRRGDFPYYGASGIIDSIDDYIFDGEFILLAEDGANIINRSTRIAFLAQGKFWVNNHAHVLKAKGSNYFLAEYLESLRFEQFNTGTAQPKLNAEVCKKIPIRIPILEEQQKIALFLSAIDGKIRLLERRLELLQTYKRGVIQKLFSQEMRFKREDGSAFPDWESKLLGNFVTEYVEKVPFDTDVPIYTSSREGLKSQRDYFNNRLVDNKSEYKVVPLGFFTYRHMSDDATFKFNFNDFEERIAVSKEYPVFKAVNADAKFILYKLNEAPDFETFAKAQKVGGTRTRLYFKNLCSWKTSFPSLEEQRKIAAFLSAIDTKLDAVNAQISQMQRFKKGLLQQMFV